MFDGDSYAPLWDRKRLTTLLDRVRVALEDGAWHTLPELCSTTDGNTASVSARIRDLRKEKFGGHVIERKRVTGGLFAYRMIGVGVAGNAAGFDPADAGSTPAPRTNTAPACGAGKPAEPAWADVWGDSDG